MSLDALLDGGGRGLGQGLVGAVLILLAILAVAVCLPVLVVGTVEDAPAAAVGATASGLTTSVTRAPPSSVPTASVAPSGSSATIDVARRYLGVRYVFGGTDPAVGLDCSGLVQLVFRQLGISLPRTAQQQYNATTHLNQDQLQPGDLVFFARTYADPNDWVTHVGIYLGDGQQINAPTEGQVVSIQPVFSGFWGAHFIGGGRVASR